MDFLRRKTRRTTVPLDDSFPASGDDPQGAVEKKSQIERLIAAARKLTKAQRGVVALRFTSDLSVAEVAEVMGKSQGAVKALQHSAVVALRKRLA